MKQKKAGRCSIMATKWTVEQSKVINTRDRNILVSAAAGSGKTAVLVERIIQLVTDEKNPLDVDKLLVVTFTNAAAAEMRERVMRGLAKRLRDNPENEHLQKQMTYIHNAMITTIDSFCLNIIREHFGELSIDPGFRIGNNDELKLLKSDVLEILLDKYYEEGDEEFLRFIDVYVSKQGKSKVEEIILKLFEEAMSHGEPKEWLVSLKDNYTDITEEKLYESRWYNILLEDAAASLENSLEGMYKAVQISQSEKGPAKYTELLQSEIGALKEILECQKFSEMREKINDFSFSRMPSITKKDDVDEVKKEIVKKLRSEFKSNLEALNKGIFSGDISQYIEIINKCGKNVDILIKLTLEFMDEYVKAKREKNLTDFAEIEHFALELLVSDGKITETAREISEDFYEILIDEYQDSNYVQEKILNAVSKKHKGINNIFMVGDVKQSIYGFRQAKPELFLEKYETYGRDDEENVKICLSNNFRSRKEILNTCNLIFSELMIKAVGGIDYDEDQALYPGAVYEETEGVSTEIILVNTEDKALKEKVSEQKEVKDENEEDEALVESGKLEIEATVIATRIMQLISSSYKVTDKSKHCLRNIRYSDIAIIVRSMKGLGDTIFNVLSERNIPVESITTTGYFDTFEIKAILNYLSVIDNPRQDIPLVSVLRNIYGFNENELGTIKGEKRGIYYDALLSYDGYLNIKVKKVLNDMDALRKMVPYCSIYDLINELLKRTSFREFVLAMGNGNRRISNIEMLLEKAVQYEGSSFSGLFNFVRYIEKARKMEVDQGESSISDADGNSVKLMTIHKSKGLEFPVVILAGTGRKFNEIELNKEIVINNEVGLGMDFVDKSNNIKYKSPIKKAACVKGRCDNKAEELRVLYVALTRAKEKLIIVGSDNISRKIDKISKSIGWNERAFGKYTILGCHSYLEWILLALSRHRCMREILIGYDINPQIGSPVYDDEADIEISVIETDKVVYEEVKKVYTMENSKNALDSFDTTVVYNEQIREVLKNNLRFCYDYEEDTKLVAKVSVSDVKHSNMQKAYEELSEVSEKKINYFLEEEDDVPSFLKEKKTSDGATRGTAYHRVFELLDYSITVNSTEDVKKMIEAMVSSGKISLEDAGLVDVEKIYMFINSSIGKRMKRAWEAGMLFREKQFVMGIDSKLVFKDIDSNETVLVQGIIDAMFEEGGEIVILDYKTDNVEKISELRLRYDTQLQLYAKAVEKSLNKKVKELVIYSTKFNQELILEKEDIL